MNSITAVQRMMLRSLLALTEAQIRQSDYLTMYDIGALQESREDLKKALTLPVVPLECCGSWNYAVHFPDCLRNPSKAVPKAEWLTVPCSRCSQPMNIKAELLGYWQDCGIQCEKCSRPQL